MALDFANVQISRLIVHEIYGRDPARANRAPSLSDQCSTVADKARATFVDRLTKALGTDSHCTEMEIAEDGPTSTFQLSAKLLECASDRDFVEISGTIATALQRAQTSALIPGGVVIVFNGTAGSNDQRFAAVIKAEVQEGFQKRIEQGHLTLQLVQDLFLTPQQKLYKIGLFVEQTPSESKDDPRQVREFQAYVYDSNMVAHETAGAAKYFAEAFLGCVVPKTAKHLTQKFYRYTKEFINEHPDFDDARKVDLIGALYTYLKVAQTRTISAVEFAGSYLKGAKEKSAYTAYMGDREFPTIAVPKDLALITQQLKRVKLRFTSDVSISAPADGFSEKIKVERETREFTYLRVQGQIRK